MSKRQQVVQELDQLSEAAVERVLAFVEILRSGQTPHWHPKPHWQQIAETAETRGGRSLGTS